MCCSAHLPQTPYGTGSGVGGGGVQRGSARGCYSEQMQCHQCEDVFLNLQAFSLKGPSEALGEGYFRKADGDGTGKHDHINDG